VSCDGDGGGNFRPWREKGGSSGTGGGTRSLRTKNQGNGMVPGQDRNANGTGREKYGELRVGSVIIVQQAPFV